MGKTHQEQLALAQQISAAEKLVTIGGTYVHYKGADKLYTVLGLGFIEADNTLCVIYQAQYDQRLAFLRPLSVWLETVEWNGTTVPRFSLIRPA